MYSDSPRVTWQESFHRNLETWKRYQYWIWEITCLRAICQWRCVNWKWLGSYKSFWWIVPWIAPVVPTNAMLNIVATEGVGRLLFEVEFGTCVSITFHRSVCGKECIEFKFAILCGVQNMHSKVRDCSYLLGFSLFQLRCWCAGGFNFLYYLRRG